MEIYTAPPCGILSLTRLDEGEMEKAGLFTLLDSDHEKVTKHQADNV